MKFSVRAWPSDCLDEGNNGALFKATCHEFLQSTNFTLDAGLGGLGAWGDFDGNLNAGQVSQVYRFVLDLDRDHLCWGD